ncbi:MAG: GNAT family N-acetyltransferase [Bdellovibrionales bacterium]|nr:GNAT family N-acetyltransferase [Bdellovibrionales bacterium]
MNSTSRNSLDRIGQYEARDILIRPITENDATEKYAAWLNDPEVAKYLETVFDSVSVSDVLDYCRSMIAATNQLLFAIIRKGNLEHVGNIKLGNINWHHRFADLGIMIGQREYWGKGYGRQACLLLLRCAFEDLSLNKVILGVHADHLGAIHLYESLGFEREGVHKNLLRQKDSFHDKVLMGIDRQRYLSIHEEA